MVPTTETKQTELYKQTNDDDDDGAAASGGGAADDDEIENPCPVCLDNEDDATVDGQGCGQCSGCGQMYCGACRAGGLQRQSPNCPTCRAPLGGVSDEDNFNRMWKLVHDRSPGRHTPVAQCNLGVMYDNGTGVKQDHTEAVKWSRCAAEQGYASAQFNLGNMYADGRGVPQDFAEAAKCWQLAAEQGFLAAQRKLGAMHAKGKGGPQDYAKAAKWLQLAAAQGDADAQFNLGIMYNRRCMLPRTVKELMNVTRNFAKAVKWFQLAAAQGHETALKNLDIMQEGNLFPTPSPGTTITTILLTSAKTAKYNNKTGKVVRPSAGAAPIKPGKVAVLLDGEANVLAFKLKNLRVHPAADDVDGGKASGDADAGARRRRCGSG